MQWYNNLDWRDDPGTDYSMKYVGPEVPHLCTADCATYQERTADPTIDAHFADRGPHMCDAMHNAGDQ